MTEVMRLLVNVSLSINSIVLGMVIDVKLEGNDLFSPNALPPPRWVTFFPSMWDGISRCPVMPSATCVMRMFSPSGS